MKSRSKSNNFIAILIALILFATGFLLLFIHKQSESREQQGQLNSPTAVIAKLGVSTNVARGGERHETPSSGVACVTQHLPAIRTA